jgi:cell division GTPase FtsZ
MIPFIIGLGGSGSRIADALLSRKDLKVPLQGLLLDTTASDLEYLSYPKRLLLGEAIVKGNGAGRDLELGKRVFEKEKGRILQEIESLKGPVDCFFVLSAIGGGTGGAALHLIDELKEHYPEPVHYAGIFPSEEDPDEVAINFSEVLKPLLPRPQVFFPIDNDLLKGEERLTPSYGEINERVSRYFSRLFEIGEYRRKEELGENVVSVGDLLNTLRGLSTIGIARKETKSDLLSFLKKKGITKEEVVVELTKEATRRTLMTVGVKDSGKALVTVAGPKKLLDRVGSLPARLWVASHISGIEVRGGDTPGGGRGALEVTVVLSGIRRSDKMRYYYQLGRLLKRKKFHTEKISTLVDRVEFLHKKLGELQSEFQKMYEEVRAIAGEEEAPLEEEENSSSNAFPR